MTIHPAPGALVDRSMSSGADRQSPRVGAATVGHAYSYAHVPNGSWSDPASWIVDDGTPATAPPGADDSVTISGDEYDPDGVPFYITGDGQAASLAVSHSVVFRGAVTTGSLVIGTGSSSSPAVTVSVDPDASLEAASATLLSQLVAIGSGSRFIVDATLTMGADADQAVAASLSTRLGGSIQLGGLELEQGSVSIDDSGSMTIGTSGIVRDGMVSVAADGVLQVGHGTIDGAIWNDGLIRLDETANPFGGSIEGSGTIAIESGAILLLSSTLDDDQHLRFDGPNAALALDGIYTDDAFTRIAGFDASDRIVLDQTVSDYSYSLDGTASASVQVELSGGGTEAYVFTGDYDGERFEIGQDDGGSDPAILIVSDAVACFCSGTLIATQSGDRPVEQLAIGDRVRTAGGALKPVLWIGRRSYDRRYAAGKPHLQPVRIRAGALGDDLPHRDLLVSPGHAILVQDALVPAGLLVNDVSILPDEEEDDIHYLHVEVEGHELLLAEGAVAESFVDRDSRTIFGNVEEYARLYPDRSRTPQPWCAPRIEDGPVLAAIRRHLCIRAGLAEPAPLPPVYGHVDEAGPGHVRGWAWCAAHPDAPVLLDILVCGRIASQVLADRFRPDLAAAGVGAGCHGFEAALPDVERTSVITVRRALDGLGLTPPPPAP